MSSYDAESGLRALAKAIIIAMYMYRQQGALHPLDDYLRQL